MNEKVQISLPIGEFLNLLEVEFDSYLIGEGRVFETIEQRDKLKALFLEMNQAFCYEGIGGIGNADSIEDYVNAFIYGASVGNFDDVDDVDTLRENSLFVSENLRMYVESF